MKKSDNLWNKHYKSLYYNNNSKRDIKKDRGAMEVVKKKKEVFNNSLEDIFKRI